MNYISLPQSGISVTEKSARAAMIKFIEELIARVPFVCDVIFSYMEQDWLPGRPAGSRRLVAKHKEMLNLTPKCESTATKLSNGWWINLHAAPSGFINQTLVRLEGALGGLPILAMMESEEKYMKKHNMMINGHVYRNLTPTQVREMLRPLTPTNE